MTTKKDNTVEKPKFIKFVEKSGLWYSISGIFILAGIFGMLFSGFNLGIDFTGGTNLMLQFKQPVSIGQIRQELTAYNLEGSSVQRTGKESSNTVVIRVAKLDDVSRSNLLDSFNNNLGGIDILEIDQIGPSIGAELKNQSVWIVLTVLGLMLLYITFRFEFWSGCAAIVALFHDALITIGFISLFKIEIDISIVVAILTILGYSINDTIVVFDRVRENNQSMKKRLPFSDIANISITQTLGRSINTSLTVLLAILALVVFGGATIKTFALVLFIGIATGTYSSIFIATPVLVRLRKIKI